MSSGVIASDGQHRICEAAIALIAAHGYSAVSMRDIVERAGIRMHALRPGISSKQELLLRVSIIVLDDLLKEVRASLTGRSPVEDLKAFVGIHVAFVMNRGKAIHMMKELRALGPRKYKRIEVSINEYNGYLSEILARGSAQGDFQPANISVCQTALLDMLTGVVRECSDSRGVPRNYLMEQCQNMAMRLVGVLANEGGASSREIRVVADVERIVH